MSDEFINEQGTEGSVRSKPEVSQAVRKTAKKQPKEEPVVMEQSSSPAVKFVCVGMGQGGCKIATTLASFLPNNPFVIAINTSDQDLKQVNLPDNQKFKIGGNNANGAGGNRNRAKQYYKTFAATSLYDSNDWNALQTFIGLYEEVLFNPKCQTIIITSFTSDGGSGSGLGPIFTANLTNYVNTVTGFKYGDKSYEIDDVTNEVPRPVVIGLTPKCDVKSGSGKLQNSIECFSEIQKSIEAGLGNFFIADNNLPSSIDVSSTEEKYNIINARIATPLLKFLGIEMNSDIKCMDLQDKINSLRIPGASAFVSIGKENLFQYVVPHGQSVTRVIPMLRYEESDENQGQQEQAAKAMLRQLDITSVDDTSVFFQIDKSALNGIDSVAKELLESSMIGFFGFRNLSPIVEDLRDNLHRTLAANDKKEAVVKTNSLGLSSINEDADTLATRFGAKTMSADDVSDLF